MLQDQAESFIADYAASEHFMFLSGPAKEGAEGLLAAFFRALTDRGLRDLQDVKGKDVEAVLMESMGRLDVPVALKRCVPDILEGCFAYLKDTGRFPPAGAWRMCVETVKPKFLAGLREDGTLRGTTFKKQYTDVGRNDPCPCGSGQKFKKCCMPLIQ